VEIRLLGPVEVWDGNRQVDIGHARQRGVLAALAVEPGTLIAADDLANRIWDDHAPTRARQTLQAYVSRVRTAIAVAGDVKLQNRSGGYVLEVDANQVDVVRFRRLVSAARSSAQGGDHAGAADTFGKALRLWRGEPFNDLGGVWAEGMRVRLAEERLAALEDRLDADLTLGRHTQVVGELIDLVRTHPLRERLVGQLMLALYHGERQSEALALYRRFKQQMDEDGLYPGLALQQLEQRILRADPALAPPPREASASPGEDHAAHAQSAVEQRARQDLADEVRRQWVREGLERSRAGANHTDVELAELPGAVRNSYASGAPEALGRPEPLPDGTRLVHLFEERFNRRCLVLGAAGAGKTTLLLELARDMLAAAADNPDASVPVVLLLSRWAERSGGLAAWVLDEMTEHYKVAADWVRSWLATGRLALLLDGLDEVPKDKQTACVHAINAFRRDTTCALTGLVVSSRTADYADLGTRLELGGAVTLQPLTAEQVDRLLQQAGHHTAALRAVTASDAVLAELLTTPLMLRVIMLAYQGHESDPIPPSHGNVEQRRRQMYDVYVDRMLTRDRGLRTQQPDPHSAPTVQATRRALVWLARLMNRRAETIFYPDWFTSAWLPGPRPQWSLPKQPLVDWVVSRVGWQHVANALTYGAAGGLIIGTLYGLSAWASAGVRSSGALDVAGIYGIVVAVTVGVATTLTYLTNLPDDNRAHRRRRYLLRGCAYAAVFFTSGGLYDGLAAWRGHGWVAGVTRGAVSGLIYGLMTASSLLLALSLAFWLVKMDKAPPETRRTWVWGRIAKGLDAAVAIGVTVGATHAVIYALSHRSSTEFSQGLAQGLAQGLIVGLSVGNALGLAFGLVHINTVRLAARWRWSPRRLSLALIAAAAYGLLYLLIFIVGVGAIMGPARAPVFGLLVGLTFWMTFAVGYALTPDHSLPPPAPAKALTASLRASIPPAAVVAVLVALILALAVPHVPEGGMLSDYLRLTRLTAVTPTLLGGLLTLWFTGGGAWLGHHVARWTAWQSGLLPPRLLGFLIEADARMLLRRTGGGYQFLHATLQDHIADSEPDGSAKTDTEYKPLPN
jgi:DNA-binding SARP family transcriptional activator